MLVLVNICMGDFLFSLKKVHRYSNFLKIDLISMVEIVMERRLLTVLLKFTAYILDEKILKLISSCPELYFG